MVFSLGKNFNKFFWSTYLPVFQEQGVLAVTEDPEKY